MGSIIVPAEGRPTEAPGSERLLEFGGANAFAVMATVKSLLREAGATRAFTDAYLKEAMSGDHDHLLSTSIAYLDADFTDSPLGRALG
jgi:hypothetical protein